MSASSTPTFWPAAASAAARLTVTDDLPTPPLPLATAYTRVSEDGWANGISRSTRPPRRPPPPPPAPHPPPPPPGRRPGPAFVAADVHSVSRAAFVCHYFYS